MTISRAELVRLSGQGCESGETLIARFAFGLAGPREMREAQQHLATCPRCGALYEQLDIWRERVAAALPIPVVEKTHPGLIDRALHGGAERLSALTHRGGSRQGGLRDRIGEATAHVKQHATSVYYRAVDPTPLAGVRPGAAAATVAGCLAIGGGATYCLQQGVGPIQGLVGGAVPAHHKKHHSKRHEEARAAQPTGTPADPVAQTPVVTTPTQPVAQTTPRRSQHQPRPKPQDEFAPGGPTAATATVHSGSSSSSKPAPAPAGGPGEFGGP
jgi:hypothetical protein